VLTLQIGQPQGVAPTVITRSTKKIEEPFFCWTGQIMNLSDIKIREASVSDMDSLVELLKDLFSIEKDFVFNESMQRRGLAMMLENQTERCIIVAETDGKVIGICSIQTLISTAEGGPVGLVEDVTVNPSYRGKGIGRMLLSSLEEWANKKGLKRLQLLADRNNAPALEFYEKMNWKKTQLICLRKKNW